MHIMSNSTGQWFKPLSFNSMLLNYLVEQFIIKHKKQTKKEISMGEIYKLKLKDTNHDVFILCLSWFKQILATWYSWDNQKFENSKASFSSDDENIYDDEV